MGISAKQKKTSAAQQFLNFATIEDGLVVLKSGGLRLVLLASSLNFALKSEQEQNALIYQYQNFINSLTFPVQILVQSRQLDLSAYLGELETHQSQTASELLKLQMTDYVTFVKRLIEAANIMDKKFFIVLAWQPDSLKPEGFFARLKSNQAERIPISHEQFQAGRAELTEKASVVANGLASLGIRAAGLETKELVELFYQSYNLETASAEKLVNPDELTASVISNQPGSTA